MSAARSVTHFVALVSLTTGVAGCGEVVGYLARVSREPGDGVGAADQHRRDRGKMNR